MGRYINVGNGAFARARNSEYVDKSGLIAEINSSLNTERFCSCVTRCRRFGKSMAANMLVAYYDQSCDSRELFRGLEIENHPSFEKHLNKYPVIRLDMTSFTTRFGHDGDLVKHLQEELIKDVLEAYPDVKREEGDDLMFVLLRIATKHNCLFIMVIDEWDAICREFKRHEAVMDEYVQLLRRLFKGDNTARVFAGVYMTGILPIKKYATESALNNFWEYSMIMPSRLAKFFGFTKDEVRALCDKYGMDFADMEEWYDGYRIGREPSMFNPSSVMKAIYAEECGNYWATTGAFTSVTDYIGMNFEGLKDDIVSMLGGARRDVRCTSFGNDPTFLSNKDEVLTLLIHLGYLAYDNRDLCCYIPNKEVAMELEDSVRENNWHEVMSAIKESEELMEALLNGDAETVAEAVERVHQDNTSVLRYNDENSLSCTLNLAFYTARNQYMIIREMPTGKGFADLVFLPRKNVSTPAIVMELKATGPTRRRVSAETALDQIRRREYPDSLQGYTGPLLICAISYDRETKKHVCVIEEM